jgi:hypothetical protein
MLNQIYVGEVRGKLWLPRPAVAQDIGHAHHLDARNSSTIPQRCAILGRDALRTPSIESLEIVIAPTVAGMLRRELRKLLEGFSSDAASADTYQLHG